ncbi:MAG: hypothetical protein Q4G65_07955, partial [bacterium]|nr:hypothetical protein [bacterium]
LGTDPAQPDTDGDGLPDGWELDHGLDPLSAEGDDGPDGDPDRDGLPNLAECLHGADPKDPDTDGDTLPDGEEVGGITVTNVPPWLAFDAGAATDLTDAFPEPSYSLAYWALPAPLVVQGVMVTNAVLDVSGAVYFIRAGCEGPEWSQGSSDLSRQVAYDDALLVAPYWGYLSIEQELSTRVRAGTATHDGVGYLLVEYANVCQDLWGDETNAVSFQVAIPTNGADRAYVRYRDVRGSETDGRYAAVGFQTFDGRTRASWCHREPGRVQDDLALQFLLGVGSDPLEGDTDGDGLGDAEEARLGTNPARVDTDSDGMPDDWELSNGLDPRDPGDAALDPDGDSLSNLEEYLNQTNPGADGGRDSDGDGVDDGTEVRRGSDPNDPSDGGVAPPAEALRELVFNIDGDYAAWEMTIQGLGPDDTRAQIITMGAPGAQQDVPKKLRKGNSYRLSMHWLNCDGHHDDLSPWYCWQAKIDGLPGRKSFDDDYDEGLCERIPQRNDVVVGNGWIAENEGGLLTGHVHASRRNSDGGPGAGNVAGSLSATLHVLDVDVEVGGVGESAEETRGAYAPWAPAHVKQGEADWTDSLVPVKVTCRPEGLPTNVTVRIVADDLLRRTADGYAAVRSGAEFPAGSVKDESFYLCARTASAAPRDKSVTATCCGVSDEAKYTAYACYFIAYVDQPSYGEVDRAFAWGWGSVDVGHAFWEMRCRPVPESVEGISGSAFLNRRAGFYGDGLHLPDLDHQPEVTKMVPISKSKLLSGLAFCENFRRATPRYSLSNYNCCNATIDAAAACGVWIKRTVKGWGIGKGLNPKSLGEDLMNNNWHYMK